MADDWSVALRSSVVPSLEMACAELTHRFVRTRYLHETDVDSTGNPTYTGTSYAANSTAKQKNCGTLTLGSDTTIKIRH